MLATILALHGPVSACWLSGCTIDETVDYVRKLRVFNDRRLPEVRRIVQGWFRIWENGAAKLAEDNYFGLRQQPE